MTTQFILTVLCNVFVLLAVLFFNKTELSRLRRLLDVLDNGGWRSCPMYTHLIEAKLGEELAKLTTPVEENDTMKGGDEHGSME